MERSKLYPHVTDILKGCGIVDFSRVPRSILEPAQKFGNAAHRACELWDLKTLNVAKLSVPLVPYLEGWKRFLKDYNIKIKPKEIEHRFISKKYGFTGTPDRYPVIKGKRTIVDIKSSTSMQEGTAIQEAGYLILLEENGIHVDQRWGVQLKPDGLYCIEQYTEKSDMQVFLSALNLFNWKKRKGLMS